jgi:hypothetical protein
VLLPLLRSLLGCACVSALLLLLFCLPESPHGFLLFALVGTGQVAQCVLQETLVWLLTLHWTAKECSDPRLL